MNRITITSEVQEIQFAISFLDNPTAKAVKLSLPISSKVKTWGDEIYFDTGITAPIVNATTDVNIGDIAYWPDGKALCIFFGPTPVSSDGKPVPASDVVVIGKADVEPEQLKKVTSGSHILVS